MGHLGPKRGQNEVLGHFLAQNALVFADYVFYDCELWYLIASGDQSAEKKLLVLKWAQLGPKRGQNESWGLFDVKIALVFAKLSYDDRGLRYVPPSHHKMLIKFVFGLETQSVNYSL